MKKTNPLIASFLILIFLNTCGTVTEGLGGSKKKGSDEFLVEKKSPLVMPPDYNELPIPNEENINKESNEIQSLISKSKSGEIEENFDEKSSSFEGSILEKIKNN